MKSAKVIYILFVMFFGMSSSESFCANLLPNSSFEVATVGDIPDCWDQYLGPAGVRDWYSLWRLDHSQSYDGGKSISLAITEERQIGKISMRPSWSQRTIRVSKWKSIQIGGTYVLSVYMKSDRSSFPVIVGYPDRKVVNIDTTWKRYIFVGKMKSDFMKTFKIAPAAIGRVWIDAIQLEPGNSPSPYAYSINDRHLFPEVDPKPRNSIMRVTADYESRQQKLDITTELSYYTTEPQASVSITIPNAFQIEEGYSLSVELATEGEEKTMYQDALRPSRYEYKFMMPIAEVRRGRHILKARINDHRNRQITEAQTDLVKLEPRANEIKINSVHRTLVKNGESFFFFGTAFLRAHLYKERLDELLYSIRKHGYTVVVPTFVAKSSGSPASEDDIKLFFDTADKHGLRVVPWVESRALKEDGGKLVIVRRDKDAAAILRQYQEEIGFLVKAVKDHPALLAWYLYDEPYRQDLIEFRLTKKIIEYTRNMDPYHPLYINYNSALRNELAFNSNTIPGDIVSMTQYPIPLRPITAVAEDTSIEAIASGGRKPVLIWLQFWSGHGRYPTREEFFCMAYLAAIYGATGFYTWPMVPGSKNLWDGIKEIIDEMKRIYPIIISLPSKVKFFNVSELIHYSVKGSGKTLYIIAANASKAPVKAAFRIDAAFGHQITRVEYFFDGKPVDSFMDRFEDSIEGYGRRVYAVYLK